ncbi:YcxB family protein [Gammaproteobacteria bacterium]|nr:YcxB family protein [Gammaproteobacteria bacterium]
MHLTDQPQMAGWVLIALAALELVHIRYRRALWLARQMWGASANSEVTLTIDDKGIRTQSPFSQTTLLWPDIDRVIETDLGHIMVDRAGAQQYLSKSQLPAGVINELVALHRV